MTDKFNEIVNKLKKNKEAANQEEKAKPEEIVTPPPQPVPPEAKPMEAKDVDIKQEAESLNTQIMELQDNGIFRLSLLREISEIRVTIKEFTAAFKKLVE